MSKQLMRRVVVLLALVALGAPSAQGGEYYYGLIFGSESQPKKLRYTHTWATFVKAVGEGPDPANYALYVHTISWLPQTLNVRVLALRPEPGVNLDLHDTINVVSRNGEHITLWGPFVMQREVYERSLEVKRIAESGEAQYRAISNSTNMLVSDCIHAVAAIDPAFGRGHYPLIRIGDPASRYIARQVMTRSPYDQYAYDNSWLIPRLGLNPCTMTIVPPQAIPKRNCVLCRCPE